MGGLVGDLIRASVAMAFGVLAGIVLDVFVPMARELELDTPVDDPEWTARLEAARLLVKG